MINTTWKIDPNAPRLNKEVGIYLLRFGKLTLDDNIDALFFFKIK